MCVNLSYWFVAKSVVIIAILVAFYMSRRSRKRLKNSNKDLEYLANNVPGGVIKYNYNSGEFNFISDGFLDLLGYSIDDIKVKFNNNFYNIIGEVDIEKSSNENIEKEYKITTASGNPMWILHSAKKVVAKGSTAIYSIIIDITESKLSSDKLKVINERDTILLNKAKNIVFEWKIKPDTVEVSDDWEEKFGYTLNVDNFMGKMVRDKVIYRHDVDKFMNLLQGVIAGEKFVEDVVRIRREPSGYVWCKVRLITTYNEELSPSGAVGFLIDIDIDRRTSEEFRKQAQRDMLTGIYNKTTAEYRIKELMEVTEKEKNHALVIIDIDDFKGINDNLGHLFGDKVLSKISCEVKRRFRKTDIIGRMGGDEFIVFLRDIKDINVVMKKADILKCIFQNSFVEDESKFKVSGSIGIAIYEGNGVTFEELYKKADEALYYSKKHGKNCYHIYDEKVDGLRKRG